METKPVITDCFIPEGTPGFTDGDIFTIKNLKGMYRANIRKLRVREPVRLVPSDRKPQV